MQPTPDPRPSEPLALTDVVHRINNLSATLLAESELALLDGGRQAHIAALERVVATVEKMRSYLLEVQRRKEASCD